LRLPEIGFVGGNKANGYDFYEAGNQILYAHGQYLHNLTLARLGTLPFLVVAAWVTFLWARSLLGDWPAVVAVFLFTTLPVILGYCTLAYVDPALMAMFPGGAVCVRAVAGCAGVGTVGGIGGSGGGNGAGQHALDGVFPAVRGGNFGVLVVGGARRVDDAATVGAVGLAGVGDRVCRVVGRVPVFGGAAGSGI